MDLKQMFLHSWSENQRPRAEPWSAFQKVTMIGSLTRNQ